MNQPSTGPNCPDHHAYQREQWIMRGRECPLCMSSEIDRLRTELAKREWQPIETAPKDGTEILICAAGPVGSDSMFVVFYDDHPDRPDNPWQTADGIAYHRDLPTHWMPRPDPPKG